MDLDVIDEGIANADGPGPLKVCCWWVVYPVFL
jgi:hypothetical protein